MRGLSLVVASGGHSSSRCAGLSLSWPLLLRSTGSRRAGSVVVAHGPSCSAACGIFSDQGSNPCPLHRQADSQPLCHQGSPIVFLIVAFLTGVRWYLSVVLICISIMILMLSTFSCVCCHLYVFFGKMSIQVLYPFFNQVVCFFDVDLYESSTFWIVTPYQLYHLQIFSSIQKAVFSFVNSFFTVQKLFSLM